MNVIEFSYILIVFGICLLLFDYIFIYKVGGKGYEWIYKKPQPKRDRMMDIYYWRDE